METMMERLARKKAAAQPVAAPPAELTILPLIKKEHEHEGQCGDGCGCGGAESDGCCGG